jgi:tyrosine-specific transport protein
MDTKPPFGHLVGGILLVAGTSIGAGMLALPVVTAEGGFFPSFGIYALCWVFMTCTGLLLLELCLRLAPNANLVSMAGAYLGLPGKAFAWVLYLFLFYCLSVAYISGGGSLLLGWTGLQVPSWAGGLLFVALFSPFVYFGARSVDRINWVLMAGLVVSYILFIILGVRHVDISYLQMSNWPMAFKALPVIFTAFSYQGVIPSLTTYMKRDAKRLRIAICGGTTLAFAIYIAWEFLILGIIPLEGEMGLAEAMRLGTTAVEPLKAHIGTGLVYALGQSFAFFAITTSFLGVTLGLMDFLADGLRISKRGLRRLLLAAITFIPPLIIALTYPMIFLKALGYAGGIGCSLLLGFLPILLAWIARKRHPEGKILLPGGKLLLVCLFLFVGLELLIELLHEFF